MRLTSEQVDTIKSTAQAVLGADVQVTLFGSRVHDEQKGGDVDLMLEVQQAIAEPALMSARVAARVSRCMQGRKVDVLLKAPNLQEQAIHRIASRRRLQIPAGAKELFALGPQDADTKRVIVTEIAEDQTHDPARDQVDGIGLRPVQRDLDQRLQAVPEPVAAEHRHLPLDPAALAQALEAAQTGWR